MSWSAGALGFIDRVREQLGWFPVVNLPLVGERVELAAELSIFLGFGVTLAATATQTYISRTVPLGIHGRTFALLGMARDGLTIPPLLALGAIATTVGVRPVLALAPWLLLALAAGVDWLSTRWRTGTLVTDEFDAALARAIGRAIGRAPGATGTGSAPGTATGTASGTARGTAMGIEADGPDPAADRDRASG
ncbi:MAG: hypothetical protein EXR65_03330 [Dehalococcoidia bacterium]|nr:hypothetical protein [Dehalococcoidia bacterium]